MNQITDEQLRQLRHAAEAGEAKGQYLLAGVLSQKGDMEESGEWLRKAADSGLPDAVYTLGTWYLSGSFVAKDLVKGYGLMVTAFEAGLKWLAPVIGAMKAIGHGTEASWPEAVKLVGEAARGGNPSSMVQIAMLTAIREPGQPAVDTLLRYAAQEGEPYGICSLGLRKLEAGGAKNKQEAWFWLRTAAERKHPTANQLVAQEGPGQAANFQPATTSFESIAALDWEALLGGLAEVPLADSVKPKSVLKDPRIDRYPGFLSRAECSHLVFQAMRCLKPSGTIHPVTGEVTQSPIRTSADATFWPINQDLVVHAVNHRIAAQAGHAPENQEMLCVLYYEPGQEYKPHFDYLFRDKDGKSEQLDQSGQRIGTFLVYLNDAYEGGETEFPKLDLKVKGAAGEGLYFENTLKDGLGDERTLHAGIPVVSGSKWLATKWIREKPFIY